MSEKDGKFSLDIGIGAKAEIKAEIPPESSGRLVDALTDMIRPFSERRGLAADQLRLQRAEVAIEIARLARERLEIEQRPTVPLPTKIVVPLLEKGSLEDPDDKFMIAKWAALLASGDKADKVQPRFISILSELSSSQVRLLSTIGRIHAEEWEFPHQQFGDAWMIFGTSVINDTMQSAFKDSNKNKTDQLLSEMFSRLSGPGRFIMYLDMTVNSVWDNTYIDESGSGYETTIKTERDIEILASLSLLYLVERNFIYKVGKKVFDFRIKLAYVTWMGVEFIELCDPEIRKDLRALE